MSGGVSGLAAQVARIADAVEGRDRLVERGRDPRLVGEGSVVRLLLKLPGFAALWTREVPAEHVEIRGGVARVSCPCGVVHELEAPGVVMEESAECPRWWLATERSVRVHRVGEGS